MSEFRRENANVGSFQPGGFQPGRLFPVGLGDRPLPILIVLRWGGRGGRREEKRESHQHTAGRQSKLRCVMTIKQVFPGILIVLGLASIFLLGPPTGSTHAEMIVQTGSPGQNSFGDHSPGRQSGRLNSAIRTFAKRKDSSLSARWLKGYLLGRSEQRLGPVVCTYCRRLGCGELSWIAESRGVSYWR